MILKLPVQKESPNQSLPEVSEDYVIEKLTKISKGIGHKFC